MSKQLIVISRWGGIYRLIYFITSHKIITWKLQSNRSRSAFLPIIIQNNLVLIFYTIIEETNNRQASKFKDSKDFFLNKNDKVELIEKIANAKNDTIKWVVGIGFLQLISIVAVLIAIIKFTKG